MPTDLFQTKTNAVFVMTNKLDRIQRNSPTSFGRRFLAMGGSIGVCLLFLAALTSPALRAADTEQHAGLPDSAQVVAYPDGPGADNIPFLHLRKGALIESIAFSSAYLRAAPSEDCIVLFSPKGAPIGGVAVYTKANHLFLRSVAYGVLPLPGLTGDDINRTEKIMPAIAKALKGATRLTISTANEPDELQLTKAVLGVNFFPSTISEVELGAPGKDGAMVKQKRRMLVLDWDQKHYLWSPVTGVIEVPAPIDPLTNTPYLCVQHPELVECLRFEKEFARLHPDEQVAVLIDPLVAENRANWFARGIAAVAYTDGPEVKLHTTLGVIQIKGASRGDFADLTKLTGKGIALYHSLLNDHWKVDGPVPLGLAGDTDELQLERTHFRLQVAEAFPEKDKYGAHILALGHENRLYGYAPAHGNAYNSFGPQYLPLLLNGVFFADVYLKDHPGEKVVAIAHPPVGRLTYPQGGINAHVFYTKGGELWGHITYSHGGEYRVVGAVATDIDDRPKLLALCYNNLSMDTEIVRETMFAQSHVSKRPVSDQPKYDSEPFESRTLFTQLQKAGVPSCLIHERERLEDGRVIEYPAMTVAFRWAGEWFVYTKEKVLRARACGYPSDMVLN